MRRLEAFVGPHFLTGGGAGGFTDGIGTDSLVGGSERPESFMTTLDGPWPELGFLSLMVDLQLGSG